MQVNSANKLVVTPNIVWYVISCNYYGNTKSMEPNNVQQGVSTCK